MIEVPHDPKLIRKPSWKAELGYGGEYSHITVWMKCPNGHIGNLGDHEIEEDGTVTPSVMCDSRDCHFHDMVKLMDWYMNA